MAKKEAKKEEVTPAAELKAEATVPAVQETIRHDLVAAPQEKTLAEQMQALGASASLVRKATRAAENFELMDTPRIPVIKPSTGGLVMDITDPDSPELTEIQGVILYGEKNKAFYLEEYVKGSHAPPDCYSLDAKAPEKDSPKLQNPVCKTCPQNKFETARQGKGKACRDIRKLFILESVKAGEESIMPRRLNITPSSIGNFETYISTLVSNGLRLADVETKITAKKKNREDKHVVLNFTKVRVYDEDAEADKQVLANIAALKTLWLPVMKRSNIVDDLEELVEEDAAVDQQPKGAKAPTTKGNVDY